MGDIKKVAYSTCGQIRWYFILAVVHKPMMEDAVHWSVEAKVPECKVRIAWVSSKILCMHFGFFVRVSNRIQPSDWFTCMRHYDRSCKVALGLSCSISRRNQNAHGESWKNHMQCSRLHICSVGVSEIGDLTKTELLF